MAPCVRLNVTKNRNRWSDYTLLSYIVFIRVVLAKFEDIDTFCPIMHKPEVKSVPRHWLYKDYVYIADFTRIFLANLFLIVCRLQDNNA